MHFSTAGLFTVYLSWEAKPPFIMEILKICPSPFHIAVEKVGRETDATICQLTTVLNPKCSLKPVNIQCLVG